MGNNKKIKVIIGTLTVTIFAASFSLTKGFDNRFYHLEGKVEEEANKETLEITFDEFYSIFKKEEEIHSIDSILELSRLERKYEKTKFKYTKQKNGYSLVSDNAFLIISTLENEIIIYEEFKSDFFVRISNEYVLKYLDNGYSMKKTQTYNKNNSYLYKITTIEEYFSKNLDSRVISYEKVLPDQGIFRVFKVAKSENEDENYFKNKIVFDEFIKDGATNIQGNEFLILEDAFKQAILGDESILENLMIIKVKSKSISNIL